MKDVKITIRGKLDENGEWVNHEVDVGCEYVDEVLEEGSQRLAEAYAKRIHNRKILEEEERKKKKEEEAEKKKFEKAMAQERREKLEKMANDRSFGEHHILAAALMDIIKQIERPRCPRCGGELYPSGPRSCYDFCCICGWSGTRK